MVDTVSTFLTVKYKLYNPSQRRRAMLLDAMRRAHLGYDKLLRTVRADVEAIVDMEEKQERWDAMKALTQQLQAIAKPLPLGAGPKQAIIADALAQAESYIELKKADPNTSYPTTPKLKVDQVDFDAAFDGIADSRSILEENEYRDLLAKLSRPGLPRPLNILKNRISDGALLLQDERGRLFVFINLLPKDAKRKHQVDLTGLIDTRTGEIMRQRTGGGDIFPIECGRWHDEKFLKRGTIQSSRLIYDGKDFYFAATFQFEAPVREPTTYLGVDRGIELLAAWSVIGADGKKVDGGYHSGEKLRRFQRRGELEQKDIQRRGKRYSSRTRRAVADEEVHIVANKIVAMASKHNAQVIMEDLKTITMGPHHKRPKGARRGGFRRMLTRAQYAKLKHCVDYRLKMGGFAPTRRGGTSYLEVHPAYTSVTCGKCAHLDKESRKDQALFVCTKCGHKDNADANAAANIAAKGIHFNQIVRGRKKGQKLKEHEQFSAWYADLKNGGGVHADGP